ncbi:MAG TPA: methyltransferase [Spirochaetia bacterium]|nr:methyltransferase [Spirochaetia bacterium]
MKVKVLVGSGDRVMGLWVPFAVVGIVANILWPGVFTMGFGLVGRVVGVVVLVIGVPLWLTSVAQILILVPKKRLITTGPYAVMLHPLYTSVALLVVPGVGLLIDTWLGFALGAVLYISSRIFSPREETILASIFGAEYTAYRDKVIFPWL